MDFKTSRTCKNILLAFAGESQARNRYTFAASQAKTNKLHVIERVFTFTADQEKEHAKLFYNLLQPLSGENIAIDGTYPVDGGDDVACLLRGAQHNEYEEYGVVYPAFAQIAREEGFTPAADLFANIAAIEKVHGDRFGYYAQLMADTQLFSAEPSTVWMCLNCGHIQTGPYAPAICPVCSHNQGYFIRAEGTYVIGQAQA